MLPELWYYAKDDKRIGPIKYDELKIKAASGEITLTTLVWRKDLPEWIPASQVFGDYDGEKILTREALEKIGIPADSPHYAATLGTMRRCYWSP